MNLADILGKLADGQTLSANEKQDMMLQVRRMQEAEALLTSLIQPGTKILNVDGLVTRDAKIDQATITNATITDATIDTATINTPIITDPSWNSNPLHSCFAQRIADTTIPNTTNTYITFDTVANFGDIWTVDGEKIYWNNIGQKAFSIKGYVTWAGNATGYRAAWIEGFDENDVSLGTSPLHTFAGNNLVDNVCPISFSYYFNGFAYVKFYVHQSSGGNLTMKDFLIGLSIA